MRRLQGMVPVPTFYTVHIVNQEKIGNTQLSLRGKALPDAIHIIKHNFPVKPKPQSSTSRNEPVCLRQHKRYAVDEQRVARGPLARLRDRCGYNFRSTVRGNGLLRTQNAWVRGSSWLGTSTSNDCLSFIVDIESGVDPRVSSAARVRSRLDMSGVGRVLPGAVQQSTPVFSLLPMTGMVLSGS